MAGAVPPTPLPPAVPPEWLIQRLATPGLTVLDASWFMPTLGERCRSGFDEYVAGPRIPGSLFLDIDGVCDRTAGLPHMLPTPASFAAASAVLGLGGPDDPVVVYDRAGMFSAPRGRFTLVAFGHRNVAVLDGGLPAYVAAGGPLDEAAADAEAARAPAAAAAAAAAGEAPPQSFTPLPTLRTDLVRNLAQVTANIGSRAEPTVDARSAGRFQGTAPEPRPGLPSGHIPGTTNVPFDSLLTPDGRFKPAGELAAALAAAGVDLTGATPTVFTCGTGVTACVVALAAEIASGGKARPAVYDGSWTEWGGRGDTPKATGPA